MIQVVDNGNPDRGITHGHLIHLEGKALLFL
jgi:hypothetical protein